MTIKETIKMIASYIVGLAMMIIFVDAICFGLWIASDQFPADGFYAGRITAEIIRLLTGL